MTKVTSQWSYSIFSTNSYISLHDVQPRVCMHMCVSKNKINTHSQRRLLKAKAALTVKVTARSSDFTEHTMLASPCKHSAKVKKKPWCLLCYNSWKAKAELPF